MEGANQEVNVDADNADNAANGAAAASPAAAAAPAPSLVVSDEAIATLVALSGGDEASARALLEVKRVC